MRFFGEWRVAAFMGSGKIRRQRPLGPHHSPGIPSPPLAGGRIVFRCPIIPSLRPTRPAGVCPTWQPIGLPPSLTLSLRCGSDIMAIATASGVSDSATRQAPTPPFGELLRQAPDASDGHRSPLSPLPGGKHLKLAKHPPQLDHLGTGAVDAQEVINTDFSHMSAGRGIGCMPDQLTP
jgi:hypothetical protein